MIYVGLEPHTIDISVLRELNDPNYSSRYPPFYTQAQHMSVSLFNCESHKQDESLRSSNGDNECGSYMSKCSTRQQSVLSRKRSRIFLFLKNFVKKTAKAETTSLQRISSLASSFTDPLYPQQVKIPVKQDSAFEMLSTRSKFQGLSTNVCISGMVISPMNCQLGEIGSDLYLPRLSRDMSMLAIGGETTAHSDLESGEIYNPVRSSEISHRSYDGVYSGDWDGQQYIRHAIPPARYHLQSPGDYQFCTHMESDHESCYSFTKSPAGMDLRESIYDPRPFHITS